jgi:hypothetical protein
MILLLVAYTAWHTFAFTAPADSIAGVAGRYTVSGYEMLLSTSGLAFTTTTPVPLYSQPTQNSAPPVPLAPGVTQRVSVQVPGDTRTRYFKLVSFDHDGNRSLPSNVAAAIGSTPTWFPDSVRDDFAGQEGAPLGPLWQGGIGAAYLQGGRLRVAEYADLFWTGRLFGPRPFVRFTYGQSTKQACLLLKIQPNASRIEIDYEPTGLHLNLLTDGVWSGLGTWPVALVQGDVLYARCDQYGNLEVWKNGTLIVQRSLAWKYATLGGRAGISLWGDALVDDFGAGQW